MCKYLTIENVIFVLIAIVWISVAILIPVHVVIYPTFTNTSSTYEMIRNLDNACITVSSVIIASILAMVAIIVTKVSNKIIYRLLDVSAIPFFGLICGFFSLYLSYFDFNNSKFLLALTMEFTIGGIFALYLILTLKRNRFFEYSEYKDSTCDEKPKT